MFLQNARYLNFLTSQPFLLIPVLQSAFFPKTRVWASVVMWLCSSMYHLKPTLALYTLDQLGIWLLGPYLLSFNTHPVVLLLAASAFFWFFFVSNRKPTSVQHSLFVHFPIILACILQKLLPSFSILALLKQVV